MKSRAPATACASTSQFLRRIVPLQRLGTTQPQKSAETAATITSISNIGFGTNEWRQSMCLLYRNLLCLHREHIRHPMQLDLGNRFLRTEFRRAAKLNEKYALLFYKGWVEYGVQ